MSDTWHVDYSDKSSPISAFSFYVNGHGEEFRFNGFTGETWILKKEKTTWIKIRERRYKKGKK